MNSLIRAAIDTSTILWLEHYQIKNERGDPISFHDHLFQYDLLTDQTPIQAWQKPAQVGMSLIAVIKALWTAKKKGMDIIYTLPTDKDRNDFVSSKVNRLISQNQILLNWTKDKDSVEQKSIGGNQIYFRGTFSKKTAMMIPSDLNIYDEEDASNAEVIEEYATRLQHSRYKWEWHFSHPSVMGYGVNKHFEKSDQKHWFIKCSKCNKEQIMEFPANIDIERKVYICKFCKKELKEEDRRVGRWVKKYRDRKISGYQISSLFCPWISAEKIIEYYTDKSEEYFYNKVLGLPYVGADNVVSEEMILGNCIDEINKREDRIVIGCDTGLTQYYVMGNKQGIFHYSQSPDYNEIRQFMRDYPTSVMVMDSKGDLTRPRELQEEFPGRIFLCEYRRDKKTYQLVSWGTGNESGVVRADRNRMIQLVIDEFKRKRIALNGTRGEWQDFYRHWDNIYRVEDTDALGMPIKTWERKGDDHWVHATTYWRVGMAKYAQGAIILNKDTALNQDKWIIK